MENSKQLTSNVENATGVVKKENTDNQKQNAVVNNNYQKTLDKLEQQNKQLSESINNLTEQIRTINTKPVTEATKPVVDLGKQVWDRIRNYQAGLKGVKLNIK